MADKFDKELEDTRQKSDEVDDDEERSDVDDQEQKGDEETKEDAKGADYWKSRATRAEQRIEKLKTTSGESKKSKPTAPTDDEQEAALDLRFDGYSKAEIAEISTYAKAKGISIAEARKSEFVQAGIEKLRAKDRSEDATPRPSGRVFVTPAGAKKTFAEMTRDERKASFDGGQLKTNKRSKTA